MVARSSFRFLVSCAESCNYVSEMPRHWRIPLDFILRLCQISPARCSQLSIAFCKSKVDSSHAVGPTLQMVNTGEDSSEDTAARRCRRHGSEPGFQLNLNRTKKNGGDNGQVTTR